MFNLLQMSKMQEVVQIEENTEKHATFSLNTKYFL